MKVVKPSWCFVANKEKVLSKYCYLIHIIFVVFTIRIVYHNST